jgi:hypothetical protein
MERVFVLLAAMAKKPDAPDEITTPTSVDRVALQAAADERGVTRSALIREGLVQIGVPLQAAAGQHQARRLRPHTTKPPPKER